MVNITDPASTLQFLTESTYCLWVGAGISCQLAKAGSRGLLDWNGLVEWMEKKASIVSQVKNDLPWRLQECHRKIGFINFQRYLREKIFLELCESVKAAAKESSIPVEFRQIATLGFHANPIINFNIEHLSSIALARAGGPCETRCFRMQPSLAFGYKSHNYDPSENVGFRRLIYHPHGLITESGQCVLGADTYAIHGQDSSLGVKLAVQWFTGSMEYYAAD